MKYLIYDKISIVEEHSDKLKACNRAEYWSKLYQNDFKIVVDKKLLAVFANGEMIYCADDELREKIWYKQ